MSKSSGRAREPLRRLSWQLAVGLLAPVAIFGAALGLWVIARPTPEKALAQIEHERTEDTRMDALILAGGPAETYVVKAIKNRAMKNRIDAIGFLGNQRTAAAAPVLRALVEDNSETSEVRAAALEALAQVDESEGRFLAEKYKSADFPLALTARRVLTNALPPRRSFVEALISCHDC
jgi:HEAT repeat protein